MTKENKELRERIGGIEEMVANLIVDQQAMTKVFQECGDRHSGSLERHRANLNSARREIDRLQVNQLSRTGIFHHSFCLIFLNTY